MIHVHAEAVKSLNNVTVGDDMEKYEINKHITDFKSRIEDLKQIIDLDTKQNQIQKLENLMLASDFWNDANKAQKVVNELNSYKTVTSNLVDLVDSFSELEEYVEIDDDSFAEEIEQSIINLEKTMAVLELEILLSGKYDKYNAIVDIHPGAGGTESQDWAAMIYDMYLKYASHKGFKVELIDYINGEEAGLKSVSFLIKGINAYGYLKSEVGVHRLVRISPFDSNSRRHTSFASVDVTPELDDSVELVINEEDLRIDTFRSSGAGGQSVNTTDSAVRIKHIPSGIVVSCQNERSQIANRKTAMEVLKAKLFKLEEEKKEQELKNISGDKMDIGFGSQIRSYVLHPYSMVKDHRTNFESSQPDKVFAGQIDEFISEYLKKRAE